LQAVQALPVNPGLHVPHEHPVEYVWHADTEHAAHEVPLKPGVQVEQEHPEM